jgi:hypothetical protein
LKERFCGEKKKRKKSTASAQEDAAEASGQPAPAASESGPSAQPAATASKSVSGHTAPNYVRELARLLHYLLHECSPHDRQQALQFCFVYTPDGKPEHFKEMDEAVEELVRSAKKAARQAGPNLTPEHLDVRVAGVDLSTGAMRALRSMLDIATPSSRHAKVDDSKDLLRLLDELRGVFEGAKLPSLPQAAAVLQRSLVRRGLDWLVVNNYKRLRHLLEHSGLIAAKQRVKATLPVEDDMTESSVAPVLFASQLPEADEEDEELEFGDEDDDDDSEALIEQLSMTRRLQAHHAEKRKRGKAADRGSESEDETGDEDGEKSPDEEEGEQGDDDGDEGSIQ